MVAEEKPLLLLVDDDPNDEELARIALEETQIPLELVIKRDGAEALQWVEEMMSTEYPIRPGLILLDLKLPKMTGLEVLERLKADPITRAIPIVVFTSSSESRDMSRSYDLGANAYLRKPVNFGEYRQTISDTSRFWILRNRCAPRTVGFDS